MYQKGSNGLLGTVAENTMGPGSALKGLIAVFVRWMNGHVALGNTLIATVQVAIGISMIALAWWSRDTSQPSGPVLSESGREGREGRGDPARLLEEVVLGVSILWGLGVWLIGEGAGSLTFPQASMLMGAPGAALLYSLAACFLWPGSRDGLVDGIVDERAVGARLMRTKGLADRSVSEGGLFGYAGSLAVWAALWCLSSLLELESGNFAANGLAAQVRNLGRGEPGWIHAMDTALSSMLRGRGTFFAGALLVAGILAGWMVVRTPTRRAGLLAGMILAALFWVVGQNFGGVFSGQATDLNSGPVLILLALLLWPRQPDGPTRRSADHTDSLPADRQA